MANARSRGRAKGANKRSSVKRPLQKDDSKLKTKSGATSETPLETKRHAGVHRYKHELKGTTLQYAIGFLLASVFSLAYYVVPGWLILAGILLISNPFSVYTLAVITPIVISAVLPPMGSKTLLQTRVMQYIPMYFQYKEILEVSHDELAKLTEERPTIISLHPHGVFTMVALCSAVVWSDKWWNPNTTPTAVANSIVNVPLLKHIVGTLGITSASAKPLIKTLNNPKNRGCILYPGGTSELFLTNPDRERLHLLDRKGFIKIALTQGCALVPGYLFGNTRVLRLFQSDFLRAFSRKTGFALTYLYGRFFLPMPLPEPCMCVVGRPILFPKIENPSKEEVDKWHAIYISELLRIYNTYRSEAPGYENKELELE